MRKIASSQRDEWTDSALGLEEELLSDPFSGKFEVPMAGPKPFKRRRPCGQTLVNVVETFYVSRLGTDALVGVALVFPVWMLMTMMAAGGIGGGGASAVARAAGPADMRT
jgi:MatE